MDTGKNESVSRTSVLAHGAAFLVMGFATGLCTRAASDLFDRPASPPEAPAPRDVFVVAPATDDAPEMVVWVAAELDERFGGGAAKVETLGYRWADGGPPAGARSRATGP